jgi:hypothetical protein
MEAVFQAGGCGPLALPHYPFGAKVEEPNGKRSNRSNWHLSC